ncbi:MAG: hypothetical protein H6509_04230 [Bryobacterales bacterium]|nr:hypothetical protein [Bryobacterales bacterium]
MKRSLFGALVLAALSATAADAQNWGPLQKRCQGTTLQASAQLMNIQGSWEAACARQTSGPMAGLGKPRCVNNLGMWGEWTVPNHPECSPTAGTSWAEIGERCVAPNQAVVSAKLMGIRGSWEAACAASTADAALQARGVRGSPRCIKTVTGMYGEWTKPDTAKCAPAKPLEWGDVGHRCSAPNQGVVSAKLYNVPAGASWEAACNGESASGAAANRGASGRPARCVTTVTGIFGEWDLPNDAACAPKSPSPRSLASNGGGASTTGYTWGDVQQRCTGNNQATVSAKLYGIPYGHSWEDACSAESASGAAAAKGADGLPARCIPTATGIFGEWDVDGKSECAASKLEWSGLKEAGCMSPDKQVYSARLWNIPPGRDWVESCQTTDGPAKPYAAAAGESASFGTPDRCVKDALSTGVWGEWYAEGRACSKKLEWGSFKNNGCVKDMKQTAALPTGFDYKSKRAYSAVLYNIGGDWMDACRFAPAEVRGSSFLYPTACTIEDADAGMSWVTTVVFAAAGAAATAPLGGTGAIVGGVVGGAVSKAAEGLIWDNVDTSLNVWGVFLVDDPSCGEAPEYTNEDYTLTPDGRRVLRTGEVLR